MEFDRLLHLFRELERHRVEYVLVGGVALNIQGIVRATEDVDLFVRPDEENIARLLDSLRAVWDDPAIGDISAADLIGDYPTVRYGPPDEDFVVDLMARLGTAFRFEDLAAETIAIEGTRVRVATPRTLYRMKRATLRPIDRADAAVLAEKFALGADADAGDEV
jgi:Nucleotidyl transferase AbiEii toxin, Type IV TA system